MLLGDGRHARERNAGFPFHVCSVPDDEDVRAARNAEIWGDDDAPGAVGLGAEPPAGRRSRTPAAQTTVLLSISWSPSMTPEALQSVTAVLSSTSTPSIRASRWLPREPFGERGEEPRTGLHEDDARGACLDIAEVGRQRLAGELGKRAGDLHAGRPAADDHEREQASALVRAHLGFRLLEGHENSAPEVGGVLDLLDALRVGLPFVMAEVGVTGAGSDDELVVGIGRDRSGPAGARCRPRDLGERHAAVLLVPRMLRIGTAMSAGESAAVAT